MLSVRVPIPGRVTVLLRGLLAVLEALTTAIAVIGPAQQANAATLVGTVVGAVGDPTAPSPSVGRPGGLASTASPAPTWRRTPRRISVPL